MPKPTTYVPQLMTVQELAQRLGVSTRTIRRWIDAGKLRSYRLGRGVRVSEDDALAMVAGARR